MKTFFHFRVLTVLLSLVLISGLQGSQEIELGDPPRNRVWDRDDLFRNEPGILKEISKALVSLKTETDMEVFLIIHSGIISEKPFSLAMRSQDAWLGEDSDGLVLVLSTNGPTSGVIGRSMPLYEGHFLEEGKMPRIDFMELKRIVENSITGVENEDREVERIKTFAMSFTGQLKEKLASQQQGGNSNEVWKFMGWITLIAACFGLLIALGSKLLGTVDQRSRRTYRFPEFTVAERLRASNGGGKVSSIRFGPSSGGR